MSLLEKLNKCRICGTCDFVLMAGLELVMIRLIMVEFAVFLKEIYPLFIQKTIRSGDDGSGDLTAFLTHGVLVY